MAFIRQGKCSGCGELRMLMNIPGYYGICGECIEDHKNNEMKAALSERRQLRLEERVAFLEEELYKFKKEVKSTYQTKPIYYG